MLISHLPIIKRPWGNKVNQRYFEKNLFLYFNKRAKLFNEAQSFHSTRVLTLTLTSHTLEEKDFILFMYLEKNANFTEMLKKIISIFANKLRQILREKKYVKFWKEIKKMNKNIILHSKSINMC